MCVPSSRVCPRVCVCVCASVSACVCDCVEPKANRKMHGLGTNVNTKPRALTHTDTRDRHATAWPNISASAARRPPFLLPYPVPGTAPGLPGLVTYKSDLHNSNNAHFGAKRIANYLLKSPTHAQIQIADTCTYIYVTHTHTLHTHTYIFIYICI